MVKKTNGRMKRYVAVVEGVEYGVPFRVMMKRMDSALNLGKKTNGIVTDLNTGRRMRHVAGDWHDA